MANEAKVKWVKAAGMWCLTTYEVDKKTGKLINKVTWHNERPEIPIETA